METTLIKSMLPLVAAIAVSTAATTTSTDTFQRISTWTIANNLAAAGKDKKSKPMRN